MALLICPECKNEVSEYADKCPNCGCPTDIIKNKQNEHLYTIINGTKKDVTYFVNKILDESYQEDVLNFNLKLMDELDVSMIDFIDAVRECNGAPEILNVESITEWKAKRQITQASKPKCPICNSTNVNKISSTKKAMSIIGFGILSNKIGKQWHCNNCKSDF